MTDPNVQYSYVLFRFQAPFRLFVDEGVYFVRYRGVKWRLALRDVPNTRFDGTTPPIEFGRRTQIRFDSHGFAGRTEFVSGYPLDPPLTWDGIFAFLEAEKRITLRDAIEPVNQLLSFYRAKTNEFWFPLLNENDILAHQVFVLPIGTTATELFVTSIPREFVQGFPFLKTEEWYNDLLSKLDSGETLPLFTELWLQAEDAFERNNLRLSASLLPMAVEALFRNLLFAYWKDEDANRRAEEMLGRYFRRYREIADPGTLPMTKKDAIRSFHDIWKPRDLLLHGHEVALTREDAETAIKAFRKLLDLWDSRPGSNFHPLEGPFVDLNSAIERRNNAGAMVRRAQNRYKGNHLADATEAAQYALLLEPDNLEARMMAGVCAATARDYTTAITHFEFVVTRNPEFPGAMNDLASARQLASIVNNPDNAV